MSGPQRGRPPAPTPRHPIRFPTFESHRLDNGLRLLVSPSDAFPIVSAEMVFPGAGQVNPLDRPGLADLHAALLTEGTNERSGAEMAAAIEHLGGLMDSGAGWNMGWLQIDLLAEHFDAGFSLLAEAARGAVFPEEQVQRLRRAHSADLLRRRDNPQALAEDAFSAALYHGTPYAFPLRGTPASLEAIDRAQLLAFHRQHFRPDGSAVVAVGDVDPARLLQRFETLFGDWRSETTPSAWPAIQPRPIEERRVILVDRPGAAQTALHLGHGGLPRRHPDIYKAMVANVMLGGKFTSRLNLNLRERHGFTYGVSSQFVRRRETGPFFVRAAVATEVAGRATEEILGELERLRQAPPSAEELRETLDYMLGVFLYTLETTDDVGNRLEALVVHDLPEDHYERYPGVLADVTAEDVLDLAQRHIAPDRILIVACGPADTLRPQLEALGPIEVLAPPAEA